MPIYEYRCESCGHELEAIQKISDDPLTDCPECGEPGLKKLISAAGFRLKGSGWYETDFKKTGSKRNLHDAGGGSADKQGKDPKVPAGTDKAGSGASKGPGGKKQGAGSAKGGVPAKAAGRP